MDPQAPAPGETPPASPTGTPAAPAAPAQPAPAPSNPPAPSGSEPETNPGGQEPAMVPSDRLREETEKRRLAEEENQRLRDELESSRQPQTPQIDEDDDLDPETEAILRRGAKKLGLVSQQELEAERVKIQVQQDVKELESQYANSGVPYDHQSVLKYAQENQMPITSKAALRAAYRDMNADKIAEIERQRAIAQLHEQGNPGGETPRGGGAQPPTESEVKGRSPKERNMSRIAQARQKLTQGA